MRKSTLTVLLFALSAVLIGTSVPATALAKSDSDNNPPGPAGGPGTNWENPPGPKGGPGASPNRRHKK